MRQSQVNNVQEEISPSKECGNSKKYKGRKSQTKQKLTTISKKKNKENIEDLDQNTTEVEDSEDSMSKGKTKKKAANAWNIGMKVGLLVANDEDVVQALMED